MEGMSVMEAIFSGFGIVRGSYADFEVWSIY